MRILSRYPNDWIVVARWHDAWRVIFSSPSIFACIAYVSAHQDETLTPRARIS